MPLKVAMPIFKRPEPTNGVDADFGEFYSNGQPVISFRQDQGQSRHPRFNAGPARSEKLELAISDNATLKLYAMFPGSLKWVATWDNGTITSRLQLELGPGFENMSIHRKGDSELPASLASLGAYDTMSWLYLLNKSCLQLNSIVYEGAQTESIVEALNDMVDTHWEEYSTFLGFLPPGSCEVTAMAPSRRNRRQLVPTPFDLGSLIRNDRGPEAYQLLFDKLGRFITDLSSLNNNNREQIFEIPVDAGQWIGSAQSTIAIGFWDQATAPLNPIYFFRLLCKWRDGYPIESGPDPVKEYLIQFDDSSNYGFSDLDSGHPERVHPLLWLLKNPQDPDPDFSGENYLRSVDKPIGREVIENNQSFDIEHLWRLFVPPANVDMCKVSENQDADGVNGLVDYGRTRTVNGHPVREVPEEAIYEWRVDDYGFLVYRKQEKNSVRRICPWEEEAYFTFNWNTWNLMGNVWRDRGQTIEDINAIAYDVSNERNNFRTPAETAASIVARESAGSARACGLEPWPTGPHIVTGATNPGSLPTKSHPRYTEMTYLRIEKVIRTFTLSWKGERHSVTLTDDDVRTLSAVTSKLNPLLFRRNHQCEGERSELFERLWNMTDHPKLDGTTNPNTDGTIWYWCAQDTRHGGTGASVPPKPFDQVIIYTSLETGTAYTWGDLLNDINGDRDLAQRVSPGAAQTLIGYLTATIADLPATWPDRPTAGNGHWAKVFEWLLEPQNAVICGMHLLNTRRFPPQKHNPPETWHTRFDPLKQRMGYMGYLTPESLSKFGYGEIKDNTVLNGQANGNSWAASYNAMVSYFNRNAGNNQVLQPRFRLATITTANQP